MIAKLRHIVECIVYQGEDGEALAYCGADADVNGSGRHSLCGRDAPVRDVCVRAEAERYPA